IFGCVTGFARVLPKEKRWTFQNLMESHYSKLFRGAYLEHLSGPGVSFNCTSLSTGQPCWFDKSGFSWFQSEDSSEDSPEDSPEDSFDPKSISAPQIPISFIVAASSAFPPLFPPVEISNETLSCDKLKFPNTQRLTDGGVYDNLGIQNLLFLPSAK